MKLLSPIEIGRLSLPNRVLMAPMTRNRSPMEIPNEMNAEYYAQRASAGLIITEATQISRQGIGYPNTPGIYSPEQLAGWRLVTDSVHSAGGRIFAQLWHCGRISHSSWQENGRGAVAPSPIAAKGNAFTASGPQPFEVPEELEKEEIASIVEQYGRAARNAIESGFDGIEIHGANGYLVDQFLRDGTNQRSDEYGGSIDNRIRFALEVTRSVSEAIGADRVGFRISPWSGYNDMRDSNPVALFARLAEELGKLGVAYLHVIEGDAGGAGIFRAHFPGAIVANGGFDPKRAEEGIEEGRFDLVSFGKPFIANPDLPVRFKKGAALAEPDQTTFYGGGEKGYVDYPAWVEAHGG